MRHEDEIVEAVFSPDGHRIAKASADRTARLSGARIWETMADLVVAESKIHGLGVFASRAFNEGEIVLILDDSRTVDDEHPLRPELGEYPHHCDYLGAGKVVLMQWPERHINSSCDPNTFVKTSAGVRHVVTRRPVNCGEEISLDYIIDCHDGDVWQCNCRSMSCRGTIVSSFFELPLELQLAYLPLLSEWFVEEHREQVEAVGRRVDVSAAPPPDR